MLTHNSGGVNGATHLPSLPPSPSRATATQASAGHRPASVLLAATAARFEKRGGEGQPHDPHIPPNTRVYFCICRNTHHCLQITFEDLWATRATSSVLQYALNSCQRSGIRSWNMKFSYIISEIRISLLDRFSDVQLCFLYTKVQYFYICYATGTETWLRKQFQNPKQNGNIKHYDSDITTHFLLPAFVLLRAPLLRSS